MVPVLQSFFFPTKGFNPRLHIDAVNKAVTDPTNCRGNPRTPGCTDFSSQS